MNKGNGQSGVIIPGATIKQPGTNDILMNMLLELRAIKEILFIVNKEEIEEFQAAQKKETEDLKAREAARRSAG